MAYRNGSWAKNKLTVALFCSPFVALLVWYFVSSNEGARTLLNCYVLLATPLFLLTGSYPPLWSRWFWKAMIPICVLMALAVYCYLNLASWLHYANFTPPARMAFGFTGTVAVLEGLLAWRIVDATEPKINGK